MKAILKNYRQSPRKVRLVADVMRGKKVVSGTTLLLKFVDKRAPCHLVSLIASAVANASTGGQAT
jgi:large subunit ribosomal protein L22